MPLVSNVVREGLRNRVLYLLAGLGLLLMLVLLTGSGGRVTDTSGNNLLANAEGAMRVGFAMAGVLSALVTVILGMNTVPREFERGTIQLLLVRPVARWQLGAAFLLGNILSAWLFLLVLLIPLFPALAMRDGGDLIPALILAIPGLLLNCALIATLTTLFSTWLPGPLAGVLGLLCYGLGAFGPELGSLVSLVKAWWAPLARLGLAALPPTGAVTAEVVKLFRPGLALDARVLFGGLLHLWAAAGLTVVAFGRREV